MFLLLPTRLLDNNYLEHVQFTTNINTYTNTIKYHLHMILQYLKKKHVLQSFTFFSTKIKKHTSVTGANKASEISLAWLNVGPFGGQ